MLTDKQIIDQQEFERRQIQGGKARLLSNTTKLEEKTYASATVYGSSSISSILPDLIAFIDSKKERYKNLAGHNMQIFRKYILPVDSDLQALLVCKVVFDHVFMPKSNKHSLTNIATAVGAAIEAECQMNYYDKEAPALLATLKKNYWHEAQSTNVSAYRH